MRKDTGEAQGSWTRMDFITKDSGADQEFKTIGMDHPPDSGVTFLTILEIFHNLELNNVS